MIKRCIVVGFIIVAGLAARASAVEKVPARTTIMISARERQLIGVTTALVVRRALIREIHTVGDVAYDPLLLPPTAGKAWINVTLYEGDIGTVKIGQAVRISLPDRADVTFDGTIASIAPLVDHETRTLRARALVADPQGLLTPARFVDVHIHIPLGEGLAIPATAVMGTGDTHYAFIDRGSGMFEPRRITIGARVNDESVQVLAGLELGERIVTSANFLIDAESALRAAAETPGGKGAPTCPADQHWDGAMSMCMPDAGH